MKNMCNILLSHSCLNKKHLFLSFVDSAHFTHCVLRPFCLQKPKKSSECKGVMGGNL